MTGFGFDVLATEARNRLALGNIEPEFVRKLFSCFVDNVLALARNVH